MSVALLVIDMQRAIVRGAYREGEVVDNIAHAVETARAAEVPVIYMQHNHATFEPMQRGADGWQIDDRLSPVDTDLIIEKTASDSFFETTLFESLRDSGISTLAICGMQTEFCVDTTARSALSHGFDVVLIGDGHTTGDAGLSAKAMIDHHNRTLAFVAHPRNQVTVVEARDLDWQTVRAAQARE